jgi:hypothetical protein
MPSLSQSVAQPIRAPYSAPPRAGGCPDPADHKIAPRPPASLRRASWPQSSPTEARRNTHNTSPVVATRRDSQQYANARNVTRISPPQRRAAIDDTSTGRGRQPQLVAHVGAPPALVANAFARRPPSSPHAAQTYRQQYCRRLLAHLTRNIRRSGRAKKHPHRWVPRSSSHRDTGQGALTVRPLPPPMHGTTTALDPCGGGGSCMHAHDARAAASVPQQRDAARGGH